MSDDDAELNDHEISRRALLERGAALAAFLAFPGETRRVFGAADGRIIAERPYLEAARRAERWIARLAIRDGRGTAWPADPDDVTSVQHNLYTGSPGIVLFYLELHAATGEPAYLARAAAGADYLMATLPKDASELGEGGAGLYTGIAGVGYTLEMVRRATNDARYGGGVTRVLSLLRRATKQVSGGVAWNASNDIISGSAGILLTLLWFGRGKKEWSEWAGVPEGAARRLIEVATPEHGGLKWGISDAVPRRYPNFSHGTAGVSYALATLAAFDPALPTRDFREAAIAGATYLDAIATRTPNDGRKIFHSEPGNEQLFYLSWCHGPAGTARLYHRLGKLTSDRKWSDNVVRLAQGIVDSGVPEQHPDRSGFWNNISQCCGNCGVSEFFLWMHHLTNDAKHLAFARRVTDDTLARATADGDGLKWIQAEHRVQPELLVAQTGLMQGAAGVGLALLHLDGALAGRAPAIVLPDGGD
jgi:lantibiotic modifying enzyme